MPSQWAVKCKGNFLYQTTFGDLMYPTQGLHIYSRRFWHFTLLWVCYQVGMQIWNWMTWSKVSPTAKSPGILSTGHHWFTDSRDKQQFRLSWLLQVTSLIYKHPLILSLLGFDLNRCGCWLGSGSLWTMPSGQRRVLIRDLGHASSLPSAQFLTHLTILCKPCSVFSKLQVSE